MVKLPCIWVFCSITEKTPFRHLRSSAGVTPRLDARPVLKNQLPPAAVPPIAPAPLCGGYLPDGDLCVPSSSLRPADRSHLTPIPRRHEIVVSIAPASELQCPSHERHP